MSSTELTSAKLRSFGLTVGGLFLLIAVWRVLFRHGEIRLWAAIPGVLLVAAALIAPRALRPVHGIWMKLGEVLGAINSRIILGVVFYVIVTPIGIVMRVLKRDPMDKSYNPRSSTYRIAKEPRSATHMRHQF